MAGRSNAVCKNGHELDEGGVVLLKRDRSGKLRTICLPCAAKREREWRDRNRAQVKAAKLERRARQTFEERRVENIQSKYKTRKAEAVRLAAITVCAICGHTRKQNGMNLSVDHDHGTNVVRGILCQHCNTGVSYLDKPGWLEKAMAYLRPLGKSI